MQAGISSLWSLLAVARSADGASGAPEQLAAEVAAWVSGCGGVELSLECGALLLDGEPVVGGIDTFAALHGLRALLGDLGVQRLSLSGDVSSEALQSLAQSLVAGRVPSRWPHGVMVEISPGRGSCEPVARLDCREHVAAQPDSRLRAVFLQHSLIAGLPPLVGIAPDIAKATVEGVVDRLLQLPHGLEPLMLLQQDGELLRRSTAVAVFATRFAHHAGWPAERLADLGVAGLLHDIGAFVDGEAPGAAGFRWLLERGDDDCWLRCALVARRWRDAGDVVEMSADLRGAVGLVRLAVAASGAADRSACRRSLLAAAADGAVPMELLAAAQDAIGCA